MTTAQSTSKVAPMAGSAVSSSISQVFRDPPGFRSTVSKPKEVQSTKAQGSGLDSLRQRKAWEVSLAPMKNVPMQGLMMYMSGSGLQIFSAMSVFFLLKQSVQGALGVDRAFSHLSSATNADSISAAKGETTSFALQKFVYVLCHVALLGIALYKLHTMGALPKEEDWLMLHRVPPRAEGPEVWHETLADGSTWLYSSVPQ